MKKILSLVLSFIFIIVIGVVAAINVRAGITTDENITVVNVEVINYEGIQGIRYSGSIGDYPKDDVEAYGILLAYGEVEDSEAFVKKGTVNNKRVVHAEAGLLDSNKEYSVTLYDIPETAYLQNISARAYVQLKDGSIVYGKEIYYNNMTNIALDQIANGDKDEFVNGIPGVATATLKRGFLATDAVVFAGGLYEYNPSMLLELLKADYKEFAGEEVDLTKPFAGSKAQQFFALPEVGAKWGFLLALNESQNYNLISDCVAGLLKMIEEPFTAEALKTLKDLNKTVFAADAEKIYEVGRTYRLDIDFSKEGYEATIIYLDEKLFFNGKIVIPEDDLVLPVEYKFVGCELKFFNGDELLLKIKNDGETEFELPEVELEEGFEFKGWYDNSEFLGEALTLDQIKALTKDTDLFAKVEAKKEYLEVSELKDQADEAEVTVSGVVIAFQSDGNSNATSKSFMGIIVRDNTTNDLICVSGLNSWGADYPNYKDNNGVDVKLFDKVLLSGTYYKSSPKSYSSGVAMPTKAYINLNSDSKLVVESNVGTKFTEEAVTITNNDEMIAFANNIQYGAVIKLVGTAENPICVGGSGSKAPFNLKIFFNKAAAVNDDTKYNGVIFSLKTDLNEPNASGTDWYKSAFSTITGPFVGPKAGSPYFGFVGEMYVVVCFYTSTYQQMSVVNFNDWSLTPLE